MPAAATPEPISVWARTAITGTPYPADAAAGTAGIPASVNFTVVNTIVIFNQPPTVTLTNPLNAATFTAPATVTFQATASDNDGSVTNVAFYEGNTKLGEDSDAPYSFLWTNVTAGAYTLTARATDNEGAVTLSSPVNISVLSTNTSGTVSGELKKWHKVMVTWAGPNTQRDRRQQSLPQLPAQRHLHASRLRQELSRARLLGGGRQRGQHQRPKRRSVAREFRPR